MAQWLESVDIESIPVQVVALDNYEEFFNLADAQAKYPALDPNHNGPDFTWAMRGEINGKPAMRFETWAAYEVYST